jgi:hypothetical protein
MNHTLLYADLAIYCVWAALLAPILIKSASFLKSDTADTVILGQPGRLTAVYIAPIPFAVGNALLFYLVGGQVKMFAWFILLGLPPVYFQIARKWTMKKFEFDLKTRTYTHDYTWRPPPKALPIQGITGLEIAPEGLYAYWCYVCLPNKDRAVIGFYMKKQEAETFVSELSSRLGIPLLTLCDKQFIEMDG